MKIVRVKNQLKSRLVLSDYNYWDSLRYTYASAPAYYVALMPWNILLGCDPGFSLDFFEAGCGAKPIRLLSMS